MLLVVMSPACHVMPVNMTVTYWGLVPDTAPNKLGGCVLCVFLPPHIHTTILSTTRKPNTTNLLLSPAQCAVTLPVCVAPSLLCTE